MHRFIQSCVLPDVFFWGKRQQPEQKLQHDGDGCYSKADMIGHLLVLPNLPYDLESGHET